MPPAMPIGDRRIEATFTHGRREVERGLAVRGIGAGFNGEFTAEAYWCLGAHHLAWCGNDARCLRAQERGGDAERGDGGNKKSHLLNVRWVVDHNKHRAYVHGMTLTRRDFMAAGGLAAAGLVLPSRLLSAGEIPRLEDALVISNVSVFDARVQQYRRGQSVLVRGDRIVAVGPAASFANPPGARVIDGVGKYLIPGLIDAHVHTTHVLHAAGLTGDAVLPLYVQHGVTSVRSTGDQLPAQRFLQRLSDAEPAKYPRVFMCSPFIDGAPVRHPDTGWTLTDPGQVPAFVAQMKSWDVGTLKLYVGVTRDVGQRVIAEGHAQGMRVAGHLQRYHPLDAVADGIDVLEHIYTVADFVRDVPNDRYSFRPESAATQRFIEALVKHGTTVDPTLMVFWGTLFFPDDPAVTEHPDNAIVPARLRDWWRGDNIARLASVRDVPMERRRRTFADYQTLVGMLHRAGVPILVGTDAPEPQVPPGASLHHEMELLVQSGMRPAEVLAAATLGNARALQAEDRLGTVEPGRLADLVLLDADPLTDIRNTRRIRVVLRAGMVAVNQ